MDFLKAMDISSSGLAAERIRMNTISSNVANANVTDTPEGGPYRRKDAIFTAISAKDSFGDILEDQIDENLQKVQVSDIVSDVHAPRMAYNPSHPNANEEGYVAMPNVNVVEEMVNLINASRAYEANITVFNASKNMAMKALDIGGNA